jgi:hypothetical protein
MRGDAISIALILNVGITVGFAGFNAANIHTISIIQVKY